MIKKIRSKERIFFMRKKKQKRNIFVLSQKNITFAA